MVDENDHAPAQVNNQFDLEVPFVLVPPAASDEIRPVSEVHRKQRSPTTAVQYTFGVVSITAKDRQLWRRETKRLRRKRLREEPGMPNEHFEWHAGLLRISLQQFVDINSGDMLRKKILAWILAPMAPSPDKIVPLSFQACCDVVGWDPEEIVEMFTRKFQKGD